MRSDSLWIEPPIDPPDYEEFICSEHEELDCEECYIEPDYEEMWREKMERRYEAFERLNWGK